MFSLHYIILKLNEMKKVFISLFCLGLLIVLSCQQCVNCTTTATVDGNVISTSTAEFCEMLLLLMTMNKQQLQM